jgi:hypothetical protein
MRIAKYVLHARSFERSASYPIFFLNRFGGAQAIYVLKNLMHALLSKDIAEKPTEGKIETTVEKPHFHPASIHSCFLATSNVSRCILQSKTAKKENALHSNKGIYFEAPHFSLNAELLSQSIAELHANPPPNSPKGKGVSAVPCPAPSPPLLVSPYSWPLLPLPPPRTATSDVELPAS